MDNANNRRETPRTNTGAPRKKKHKKISVGRIIGNFFLVIFTLCVIGVLTMGIFFKIFKTYIETTLIPSIPEVQVEELTMSLASTLYAQDANGQWKAMDTLHAPQGNRELIEFSDLPDHLVKALVAIEDHRFWEHKGVDWEGTIKATILSASGDTTRGGSTITQQILRNITKDNEVTVKRKLREIFRALEFEKTTSKEDILTLYLNYVYFGAGCDGIQTAAQKYFGKDVSELDLAESAAIIGITNNPSLYDPFRKAEFKQADGSIKTPRDFNKYRQKVILDRMAELGIITQAEAEAAKSEKLLFTDTPEYAALHANDPEKEVLNTGVNTWYVDAVIDEAIALIAEAQGCSEKMASDLLFSAGYHIYTTQDPEIQKIVDGVYTDLSNFDYPSPTGKQLDSAITIVDPYTGDVVAMAGGVGEKTASRALNLATSPRTPGSSIKPVSVYAPAIDANVVSPGSVLDNYPLKLNDAKTGGYPKNSPATYTGNTTVALGVQKSINTIASRVLEKLGQSNSFHFMTEKLGFQLDPADEALAPLAMGGLTYGVTTEEMAAAYSAFVNHGVYTRPRLITRIESNDHSEVIVDNTSNSMPAMKETTAYLMNGILRKAVSNGTGGAASFGGMHIAGKTGTTSNNFDRYFTGYTPYYAAAVWVGYAEAPERISSSKNPAAQIWKKVMEPIHANLEDKDFFERPAGIVSAQVCADCGLKPSALCGNDYRGNRVITIEMQEAAVPTETCTCHVEVKVCTDPATGTVHLAGDFCPEDTCTTRVMLQGRQFLEIPYSSPVVKEDGTVQTGDPILTNDNEYEAHLTYLSNYQGVCPIHDEFYVGETPLPGDPGWEDPSWQWPDWWPFPGIGEGSGGNGEDTDEPPTPGEVEPEEPDTTPGGSETPGGDEGGDTQPIEPEEPILPEEPVLP